MDSEGLHVSKQQDSKSEASVTAVDDKVSDSVCHAYDSLFRLMHGLTPSLEGFDINTAVFQLEEIIKLATGYRCLQVLCRSRLGAQMPHIFQDALYRAIMLDAPRYLKLSIYLESEIIFREAMVHVVGQFLHYPWKTWPAPELPEHIFQLITSKQEEVRSLKEHVDAVLFTISVDLYESVPTFREVSFKTWIVEHHWRDWVSLAIRKTDNSYPGSFTINTVYRQLAKGGDAYLPSDAVYRDMTSLQGQGVRGWDRKDVERDLNKMKDYAKQTVQQLCVNNSQLDVEEFGIKYLTCCEILNWELPWNNDRGIPKRVNEQWPVRGLRPPTE